MTRIFFCFALFLTGCANSPHGVSSGTQKDSSKLGVIESITPIELDDSSGGTAGSVAGQVGGIYSGSILGVILGSVVGGTVGSQAGIGTKPGVELWVKLNDDGTSVYVMQALGQNTFKVGDPVRVLMKGNIRKVEPLDTTTAPAAPPP